MRLGAILLVGLGLGVQAGWAFEPGEKVVLTRPVEITSITGSLFRLTPGTKASIEGVENQTLKIAAGRVGWIDSAAVVAASKADDYFSARIAAHSQDAGVWLARGKVRFDAGDIDRAIADLDQSLKLAATSEAETIRAYAWKRKGDKQKALEGFDEAIRLDPNNALAWRIRGATWAGRADYQKALADYTKSIRIDPENPDSRHHRALLLSACDDASIRDGKQAVQDATKACKVSQWSNGLYLTGLAAAYAETGDFKSAIKWQTKAIELSPSFKRTGQLEAYRERRPFRTTWH